MKKVIFCLIVICNSLILFGQYNSKVLVDSNSVFLKINMKDNYCFGCPIPFEVQLNSKETLEVFDLNTAYMSFKLFKKGGIYSYPNYYVKAAIGGWYRISNYFTYDSIEESIFEEVEQNIITINPNEKISMEYELLNLIHSFPDPGNYTFQVGYEEQINVNNELNIIIDYKKSIPIILDKLEKNQLMNGVSTLSMFYYLTGYKSWDDTLTYRYTQHYKEATYLKKWWENNKELILHIELTLKEKKYSDLKYSDRIPYLINLLESEEYLVKFEAHNELSEISGNKKWKLNASDTDTIIKYRVVEVNNWWEKNKELIIWINRVIIENRIK